MNVQIESNDFHNMSYYDIYDNKHNYEYMVECDVDDYCLVFLNGLCMNHTIGANAVEGWVDTAIVASFVTQQKSPMSGFYKYVMEDKNHENDDFVSTRNGSRRGTVKFRTNMKSYKVKPKIVRVEGKVVILKVEKNWSGGLVPGPVYWSLIDECGIGID
ncbi:MAG: hypothetical protein KAS32_30235 [Candidatus Peribacteraceae bacterium]|nr:hypothetical protein [Candidatus Peribacteraceae bacterium]